MQNIEKTRSRRNSLMKGNFAQRLRQARSESGYTSNELAKEIGVNKATISKWENARVLPSYENLLCLCKLLEKDCNFFLQT